MIVLSYQGPSFSDVRAVKLVGGVDVDQYIAGLPEASCAVRLSSADDVKLTWSVVGKLYTALADKDDRGRKFKTELEAQDALYHLAARVAKTLSAMPPSEAGKATKDTDRSPATSGAKAPKAAKERVPVADDKWSKMKADDLSAAAKKLGYKEEPAPNGGVRVMRLRNWLRNNGK